LLLILFLPLNLSFIQSKKYIKALCNHLTWNF
jgi:hypothetical protein